MDEETLSLLIEEMSEPVIHEGEEVVQRSTYNRSFDHQMMPQWAYVKFISNQPRVFIAKQASDYLRVRMGFKSRVTAGTVISRICELEFKPEIENIEFPYQGSNSLSGFELIIDIRYAKDKIDSLLYLLRGIDVAILEPAHIEYIAIRK